MLDNNYLNALTQLVDTLSVKYVETESGKMFSWKHDQMDTYHYSWVKDGKEYTKTEKHGNTITGVYSMLMIELIYKLRNEIENNSNSLLGKERKEYLNRVIEALEKRVIHRKASMHNWEQLIAGGRKLQIRMDLDKLYPLQIKYLTDEIVQLKRFYGLTSETSTIEQSDAKDWLAVGILFATGEMNALLATHKTYAAISRALKQPGWRPYISATLSNSKPIAKNFYKCPDKLKQIYMHCNENNIVMTQDFIDRFNCLPPFS